MSRSFDDYLKRKLSEFGPKFNKSDLAPEFVPYYENGKRIRVKFDGIKEPVNGTVGVTTGWKPVFLLMRMKRSFGSTYILSRKDHVFGVVK